jgi:hypothetical protein
MLIIGHLKHYSGRLSDYSLTIGDVITPILLSALVMVKSAILS